MNKVCINPTHNQHQFWDGGFVKPEKLFGFKNCKLQHKTTKNMLGIKKNAFIPFNQQNPHKKLKEKKNRKKNQNGTLAPNLKFRTYAGGLSWKNL
jgi:hypothetical protein